MSHPPSVSFTNSKIHPKIRVLGYGAAIALGVWAWLFVYGRLLPVSQYLTYGLLNIKRETRLGASIEFFLYDIPKVFMLLVTVVFVVGIFRSFFTPERARKLLAERNELWGNMLASLLGIVTPFCSCSAVPLFIGFVTAGVPLGVTFSFLISAPMVNEIALVLLYGLVGWKIAALYLGTGVAIAVVSGWIIGRLRMENHIQDWVTAIRTGAPSIEEETITWHNRLLYAKNEVKEIVGRVWIYILIGIAVGAAIHGYAPQELLASIMGKDSWLSVPLAVLIGVPIYSNAAGIIPVAEALLGKGAALGTVLAFMMSTIALSLPELIILRKVLKLRLILAFVGVITCGIILIGYLFNFIL